MVQMPVRLRRTVGAGDAARAQLVYCPRARSSRAIQHCRECEHCEGLRMEGDGIQSVLCRVVDPPRPPRKVVPTAAESTTVGALLEREVLCVTPELPREAAAALLLERGLSGAPVVDGDGRPVGMLVRSDLLRAGAERPPPPTVGDLMMPVAFSLAENDPLARAAALMAAEGVHHLLVLGDYGRVVGLLTTLDITRWLARQAGYEV